MSQNIRFYIQRFDPEKDKEPYFKEYIIATKPWQTVLEVLTELRNVVEPGLGFRMACKSGICGSCAMRINGRAKLACKTQVKDEVKKFGEVRIAPISNLTILKDLIVDMEPFYKEMKSVEPWLKSAIESKFENRVSPNEVKKIEKSSECIWCAACFSDCPSREAEPNYIGPAASVLAHRYIEDVRDKKKRERLKKLIDKQLWLCAHCERATENCPQEVAPQEIISELRETSIIEGITNNDGARHARTIEKSVKKYGEIAESKLPLGTFGPLRVLKYIPLALKLLIKGKFPPLFIKKIHKHEEVKQLSAAVQRKHQEKQNQIRDERQNMTNLERNK